MEFPTSLSLAVMAIFTVLSDQSDRNSSYHRNESSITTPRNLNVAFPGVLKFEPLYRDIQGLEPVQQCGQNDYLKDSYGEKRKGSYVDIAKQVRAHSISFNPCSELCSPGLTV